MHENDPEILDRLSRTQEEKQYSKVINRGEGIEIWDRIEIRDTVVSTVVKFLIRIET